MFKTNIKKRILGVISMKLDVLQKRHDQQVELLEKEHENNIKMVAENIVNEFLAKIL